jgi:hypothetical protein
VTEGDAPARPCVGKLVVREGKPAVLETAEHKNVTLAASEVLGRCADEQLRTGSQGTFYRWTGFLIDPIPTRTILMAHKEGHSEGDLVLVQCVCPLRNYNLRPSA